MIIGKIESIDSAIKQGLWSFLVVRSPGDFRVRRMFGNQKKFFPISAAFIFHMSQIDIIVNIYIFIHEVSRKFYLFLFQEKR